MATTTLKLNYATVVALTITNANLADSATAGWMSAAQDNTTNLYQDALVQVNLAAVNTAPAGDKNVYIFAYGISDTSGSLYTSTGDGTPTGSEGTLTFPSISTLPISMPQIGFIPYPVQNRIINSPEFSIARWFNNRLPAKYGVCMLNKSGMTLSVVSIQITPIFFTSV